MWGGTDEAQSIATIRSAIDRGVTLIDTAPVYGFGRSEEIVGKALEGSLRHKVTIATKVGLAWNDGAVYRDSRPVRIRKEIEDSLRRLRTDVIDLYQVHWPDFETPIAETARTLEDLRIFDSCSTPMARNAATGGRTLPMASGRVRGLLASSPPSQKPQ
jgi:aryl-alcohol dehydrogenase-like predicted oxidoreductase